MRTVNEDRAETSNIVASLSNDYVHLSGQSQSSRSCFYDFGARQQVRVTYSPESEQGDFIRFLIG